MGKGSRGEGGGGRMAAVMLYPAFSLLGDIYETYTYEDVCSQAR